MTTEPDLLKHHGNPRTKREWELADEIDELFIADAEQVCLEQSNRRYRIRDEDILCLIQNYGDLPAFRFQAILSFNRQIWRSV